MKKLLICALILTSLVGCQMTKSTNLTATDLYGKYTLVQFDQSPVEKVLDRPITLAFEQGPEGKLKVHGVLCNTFMGQAELKEGKLLSQGLASTRMACFREKEATMENALGTMFKEGATVELTGKTLSIAGAGHTFVYEKQ